MRFRLCVSTAWLAFLLFPDLARAQEEPGRLVSIGAVSLQMHCTGRGSPAVIVETGLSEFSFDWALVQERVERFTRICTYDRGGYGQSELAAVPRTFAQLNLELHLLLAAAGEQPPFILVGHSFGGAVIRNYASLYQDEIAGMVLAESVAEHQPILLGAKPGLLKDFASGRRIPEPKLGPPRQIPPGEGYLAELPRLYNVLAPELQLLHRRFAVLPVLEEAEQSQREWSSEYFAEWDRHPQKGLLHAKPLLVITRAVSGYDASPNYSLEEVDGRRLRAQVEQLSLSANSIQWIVPYGHEVHLESPEVVAGAIRAVVQSARTVVPIANLGVPQ